MSTTARELCPTEDTEQICLFRWAALQSSKYPELALMYHIPNGGKRSKSEAARFRTMGVKAGVPDGGTVSPAQKTWIAALRKAGYAVEVCKGWEAAAAVIMDYLEGRYRPVYQG